MKVKFIQIKEFFNVNSDQTEIEKKSLENLRKEFEKFYSVTDEKFNEKEFNKKVPEEFRLKTKGIEVGHIFYFGDKYSKPMNSSVDYNGKKEFVKMGSYGVGVSRLVGAIIEAKYDEKKEIMKWPQSVSPYDCAIIPFLNKGDNKNLDKAINISKKLKNNNIDYIIDDTEENFSAKLKKFNLIGIPSQIIIGNKTEGDNFEYINIGEDPKILSLDQIIKLINQSKKIDFKTREQNSFTIFKNQKKRWFFKCYINFFFHWNISWGCCFNNSNVCNEWI